jgi:hypothetical protein
VPRAPVVLSGATPRTVIALQKLADLEISAASGLVAQRSHVLVVPDDETYLDRYAIDTGRLVDRITLVDRELPLDRGARKAAKPDFEALAWLPHGRLLVLGSGSGARRQTGVVLVASALGDEPPRDPREVDLAPLYSSLRERFVDLNIEGAAVAGGLLRLLSRGGAGRENAVIDLDLPDVLRALSAGDALGPALVRAIHVATLGSLDGVALGFTDASPMGSTTARIAFAAAAEDTDNPYDDGPCAGSVIGVLEADGRVGFVERCQAHSKIEGLAVGPNGLLMVADPDDPAQRAPLFASALPRW